MKTIFVLKKVMMGIKSRHLMQKMSLIFMKTWDLNTEIWKKWLSKYSELVLEIHYETAAIRKNDRRFVYI